AEYEVVPGLVVRRTGGHTPGHSVVRLASGGDRLTFAGDAVFQVGFERPDWQNGFEHDPEEAARVRVSLLRELAATREPFVATHLSFPSVCHVAVAGDAFRCVPAVWDYWPLAGLAQTRRPHAFEQPVDRCVVRRPLSARQGATIKQERQERKMTKTIMLIHGAWLNAQSWEGFKARYEARGYTVIAPSWPLD